MRTFAWAAVVAAGVATTAIAAPAPVIVPRVVAERGHDPEAFTQGLVWDRGRMYESTGLYGQSQVREIDPLSGRARRARSLSPRLFGEGITMSRGRLVQVTWKEQTGVVWDPRTLRRTRTFRYDGEGWGLATRGNRLLMSDGTATIRVLDDRTLRVVRRFRVHDDGVPLAYLNELEMVRGSLWANVWQRDEVVVINPRSGRVRARLDLSDLRRRLPTGGRAEVLNGIAWDRAADRVVVTGKWWPRAYVIVPPRLPNAAR